MNTDQTYFCTARIRVLSRLISFEVSQDADGANLQDTPKRPNGEAQLLLGGLFDLLSDVVQIVVFGNHLLGAMRGSPRVLL